MKWRNEEGGSIVRPEKPHEDSSPAWKVKTWTVLLVRWKVTGEFWADMWYDLTDILKRSLWLLCGMQYRSQGWTYGLPVGNYYSNAGRRWCSSRLASISQWNKSRDLHMGVRKVWWRLWGEKRRYGNSRWWIDEGTVIEFYPNSCNKQFAKMLAYLKTSGTSQAVHLSSLCPVSLPLPCFLSSDSRESPFGLKNPSIY